MTNWQLIMDYYRKEKGSSLDAYELWRLGSYFIPNQFPITDYQRVNNDKHLEASIIAMKHNVLPKLSIICPKLLPYNKPKTLEDIYLQSLIDYKNDNCDLYTVNYIEDYIQKHK